MPNSRAVTDSNIPQNTENVNNTQKTLSTTANNPISISLNKITNLINKLGRKTVTKNIKSEYMGKFNNVDIINTDTGIQLKLNAKGIKSTLAHSNTNSKLATVKYLDSFLTNGKLVNTAFDTKGRPVEWTYFKDDVVINGIPQSVVLDIKRDINDNSSFIFYNHTIKNESDTNRIPTPDFSDSSANNISQNTENSNLKQKNTHI